MLDNEFPDETGIVKAISSWICSRGMKTMTGWTADGVYPACHEAGIPQLGICFGHQAIEKLGGAVEKWPGGWGVACAA